jgi:hypothetical protein
VPDAPSAVSDDAPTGSAERPRKKRSESDRKHTFCARRLAGPTRSSHLRLNGADLTILLSLSTVVGAVFAMIVLVEVT